jgi:hypothetical protein
MYPRALGPPAAAKKPDIAEKVLPNITEVNLPRRGNAKERPASEPESGKPTIFVGGNSLAFSLY